MICLYGSPKSSSGRVYWLLEELGLPYEAVKLNMREKEHKNENYLKLNPNGKVPCLKDGEFVIWESIAINHYLADKYSPSLLGLTPENRGLIQQWSVWSIVELQKPLIDIFIQKIFVPEDKRDHNLIEKAEKICLTLLSILNSALLGKEYIVGQVFSLADLNLASVVHITSAIQMDISTYKNIQIWLARLTERPAFQKYINLE